MCPILSDDQNSNYIWYPDEDVCRKGKGSPDWIKQQRKIAKKAEPENYWHYFTLDMLKVRFRVTPSVKGLDPDMDLEKEGLQLKAWRKRYRGTKKRKISEAQKAQKRRLLVEAIKAKKSIKHSNRSDPIALAL
jgi:hypothetical protein